MYEKEIKELRDNLYPILHIGILDAAMHIIIAEGWRPPIKEGYHIVPIQPWDGKIS